MRALLRQVAVEHYATNECRCERTAQNTQLCLVKQLQTALAQ